MDVAMITKPHRAIVWRPGILGTKDDGRDPVKRARDVEQAHTVAAIVTQHLKCFPKPVVDFMSEGDDPFFKPF